MRGRPPKDPEQRKNESLRIPLTSDEKALIEQAAAIANAKPVTWARDVVVKAAKRKTS